MDEDGSSLLDEYGKCHPCGYQQFPIEYIECSWTNGSVKKETRTGAASTVKVFPKTNNTTLASGWYHVNEDITVKKRLELTGDTHLILGDGYTLNVNGLYIPEGKTLTIYAQSDGSKAGKLVSEPDDGGVGIGGYDGHDNGNIVIHGGTIVATGDDYCAGIGSNSNRKGGAISIYNGTVTATGGKNAAGIGGGEYTNNNSVINIYGGTVTATGKNDSAGIGGGDGEEGYGNGGEINIYGGTVTATASGKGAGIGGGDYGTAKVTITGGKVKASSTGGGNGIGGGSKLKSDSSTVTLNYTDQSKADISITASAFSGTVKMEKGFQNNNGNYKAGNQSQLDKLANSALRPWDGTIRTWADLQSQINGAANGATIKLEQSFKALPSDKALTVSGKSLFIDLNGFTLDRDLLKGAPKTDGYVLLVEAGAKLFLQDSKGDGLITGGNTSGDAGGIMNRGTLQIENGTIRGNKCTASGGGIHNTGSLAVRGGAITGNTSANYSGGGIYNGGGLALMGGSITGNTAGQQGGGILNNGEMYVSDAPVVKGNTAAQGNNIYLRASNPTMTVTSALADGAELYVTKASGTGCVTVNYGLYHSEQPDKYFFPDDAKYGVMRRSGGTYDEAWLGEPVKGVPYISYAWDGKALQPTENVTDTKWMAWPDGTDVPGGMYVVNRNTTVNGRVTLQGDTSIVLVDGCTLDVKGLYIPAGKTLTVYGQSKGTGAIKSNPSGGAGIGGYDEHDNGNIVIHGGVITAIGHESCAGIGSNSNQKTGNITIYNGTVNATGGRWGAGIGAGRNVDGGTVRIYGGKVTAKAGSDSAAGIGGGDTSGSYADYTIVYIYGGTVTATGNSKGAGIGGGEYGRAKIAISGGKVTATGGSSGGAGIGSGADGAGSTITITGGEVDAKVADASAFGMGNGKNQKGISTMTFGYNEDTAAGISITSASYGGPVTLEKPFQSRNTGEVYSNATYTDTASMKGKTLVAFPKVAVSYVDLNDDEHTEQCYPVMAAVKNWKNDWYAVTESANISGEVTVTGNVNLILADGCKLDVTNIKVADGNSLTIWAQKGGTGKLVAVADHDLKAGIGGAGTDCGTIIINGGVINATGGNGTSEYPTGSAGIGGSYRKDPGKVIINGGDVTAYGGRTASGIGCTADSPAKEDSGVEIKGGKVEAHGKDCGAGIGAGSRMSDNNAYGTILITGGEVTAYGSNLYEEAGIENYMRVYNSLAGAGIGGCYWNAGVNIVISGGKVTAYAAKDGAAIGYGSSKETTSLRGLITITGGEVTAHGNEDGAAIGSGKGYNEIDIEIIGGRVCATGGCVGIGAG